MHFHKYPHATNFEFVKVSPNAAFRTRKGAFRLRAASNGDDIYHLQVTGKGWETSDSQAGLRFGKAGKGLEGKLTRLVFAKNGALSLETKDGEVLLASEAGRLFGQCGPASVFEFIRPAEVQFYGMGEKFTGLEHSGKISKFWNTDMWGDFDMHHVIHGSPDPAYVAVPYLIVKQGNTYLGLLLDNPHAAFISTKGGPVAAFGQQDPGAKGGRILVGAEQGQPNLYLLYGPTLGELTRRLQRLVGETPLPPAWALGYQQCRWGYQSAADLETLDAKFREHGIPVDGLWLDIEYMDRYKVFTLDKKNFPAPKETIAKLTKAGRKVVPIIDPGVKFEKGYGVYERGRRADAFCQNPQGLEYVGLVWPGETVFPDFSLESARAWWAKEVAAFARQGIHGAWLDMNDPSTGASDNLDMLFDHGKKNHSSFHNQFALGMAMASREGFQKAHPGERPFLLCRSGSTGTSRYTAIWTGDNYSNYHYLKGSIATTLNLALSGIPFNGPDAGGFGGDTTPELISDWFKAGFLFPFFRNHSILNSRQQEPWAFDKKTLDLLRRYIRLRYRLRPYLYQLFAAQEQTGEAILRPLFYDFADTAALPLNRVDDQFLVGPWILQAPFVEEKQASRSVVLPGVQKWYDISAGRWISGNRKITIRASALETPLYIRNGAILPLARLAPEDAAFRGEQADFHLFLSGNGKASTRYVFDDGTTFAYQKGKRSEVEISAERKGSKVFIETALVHDGYGPGDFTFTTEAAIRSVRINGVEAIRVPSQGVPFGNGKTVTWKAGDR